MLDLQADASYFYGLDGDRITNVIEDYLFRGNVDEVSRFSKLLTSTLEEIKQKVIDEGGMVEYCAGDNILFYGKFSDSWCEGLLKFFYAQTGCTASIGIGTTSAEFCLALKRAKTAGGGQIMHYWDQQIRKRSEKDIDQEQHSELTSIKMFSSSQQIEVFKQDNVKSI